MNKRQQQEQELTHLRESIEQIGEALQESRLNKDGDTVISEQHALKISVILEGI